MGCPFSVYDAEEDGQKQAESDTGTDEPPSGWLRRRQVAEAEPVFRQFLRDVFVIAEIHGRSFSEYEDCEEGHGQEERGS